MNSVVCLLDEAAKRYPERPAVEFGEASFTYLELQENAAHVGSALINSGFPETKPVLIFLPRSAEYLFCFYGAMYAARPYAPINYLEARERVLLLISLFEASPIITCEEGRDRLISWGVPAERLLVYSDLSAYPISGSDISKALSNVVDTDPIYIMHTSGSTGVPKGVVIPHRAVLDFALWASEEYEMTDSDVVGLQSPFHFDASVFDIFACLASGAKLLIMPSELFNFPSAVPEYMFEKKISIFLWVPGLLVSIANSGVLEETELPDLRIISFVGEVMPTKQFNVWRRAFPGRRYLNLYGPTETTCASTYYNIESEFADSEALPLGRPCSNTRILLIDEEGKEPPTGQRGELCILGSGLALGYYNSPESTNRAFCQNPLNEHTRELMYRTGDLAYIDESGNLMFAGRMDSQIKSKGVRVELGDIEAAVCSLPDIRKACALFDAEKQEIVVFAESSSELPLRRFNMKLREQLPDYMLPGRLVYLAELPQTATGKINRNELKKQYIGG